MRLLRLPAILHVRFTLKWSVVLPVLLGALVSVLNVKEAKAQSLDTKFAEGFSVERTSYGHRLSVLKPFANAQDTLVYRIVEESYAGELEPKDNAQVIEAPVERIILLSTTHVAVAAWLNIEDRIVGISDKKYIVNETVRRQIENGETKAIGQNSQFDFEKIIALKPDLVVTVGRKVQQWQSLQLLRENGIPILANTEWMEKTPLGRAEWGKVPALCAGKGDMAQRKFQTLVEEYRQIDRLTDTVQDSPMVMLNASYKGTWFVPGGESFMASFLDDAAAVYPWRRRKQRHSLRLDFESAYNMALKADYWIHPGTTENMKELKAKDSRYRHIPAVKNGRVYNNNKLMTEQGGNPFWERGLMEPQVILKDLITIFHPHLFPERETVYYQKLD